MLQAGPKLAQVGSKLNQVGSELAQVRPRFAQSSPKLGQLGTNLAPGGAEWQDSHKYDHVDATVGEVGTKTDEVKLNLVPGDLRLSQMWPPRMHEG